MVPEGAAAKAADAVPDGTADVAECPQLSVWQAARTAPGAFLHPSELLVPDDGWLDASAPGTVASAIRAAGNWDWRDSTTNLDDYDWWYRCHFRCTDPRAGASLDFAGLASLADVWLNGRHILASDNMFVAHTIDTGVALRNDNELVIRFRSLSAELRTKRTRPRWKTRLASHQNLRWIRTTLLGRMPGWSAVAQPVGPWKAISLIPHQNARITSRRIHARLDGTDGVVSVSVRAHLPGGAEVQSASVLVGPIERAAIVRRSGDEIVLNASIRIPDAALWWPHTHGKPRLYDAVVKLAFGDSVMTLPIGRTAFRKFELVSDDGKFQLLINGERVFWRGACWSPPDVIRLHVARGDYRRTLELARNAGMNMIRIGGTMVYEHDDFYDLCDELGIAVWQDLMFANMDYPHADPAFLASVEVEVAQLVRRVASHASLALICGNSEVEQQAAMLGLPESEWRSPLFSSTFANLVEEHAPGVPYWPSSPSGGDLPFHLDAGDGHYFGYGPYLRHPSDVRSSEVQFASECLALANVPEPAFIDRMPCGVAGAGHHPDWKRGVPRDNGASWDFEGVRDHYVREIFSVDPATVCYSDPERYLALGRCAGGELITHTIAEWRRAESPCNGALVWFYRDLLPGAGWGVLDADGAPKSAYYYLARAFRPVTVTISDEGLNGIRFHVINDGPLPISPELRLSLINGSVLVGECAARVDIEAHSSVVLGADTLLGSFKDISYAYRFGRPNHDAVIASLVDETTGALLAESFHFPMGIGSLHGTTRLAARVETVSETAHALTIGADELALAVAIDAAGWDISDNYFHIPPHSERTVTLLAARPRAAPSGRVTALNSPMSVGFRA